MKIRTSLAILGTFAMAAAPAVEAADFTLHVPVEIENTIIWRIDVKCTVLENEYSGGRIGGLPLRVIGRGTVSTTVVDGDFDRTVTVTVDADAGKLPALAKSYTCTLSGHWPFDPEVGFQPNAGDIMASSGNFQEVYEERGGRMLLSHVTSVRGPINQ